MIKLLVTIPNGIVKDTFIPPRARAALEALGEVTWNNTDAEYTEDELCELLADKDVCVTGWYTHRLTERALHKATRLRLVAHTAASVAPIVSDALFLRGIRVVSGNNGFAECVAEGVIAYILAALRELPRYDSLMRSGGWKTPDYYNRSLLGKSIGLLGFGAITRYLCPMLLPFRVKICAYDPYVSPEEMARYHVTPCTMEQALMCQIVSVHLPETESTRHILNAEKLAIIQDGALFVNTARGAVVDEAALITELQTGRFAAALDVYEQEPLPAESPLRALPNALLVPHMGGPTVERRGDVTLLIAEDIARFFANEALLHEITQAHAQGMSHYEKK